MGLQTQQLLKKLIKQWTQPKQKWVNLLKDLLKRWMLLAKNEKALKNNLQRIAVNWRSPSSNYKLPFAISVKSEHYASIPEFL
jgi:hypothetical protein